jgi:hypothetical protein
VFYRERGALPYDPFAYGMAIALVEIPYLLIQVRCCAFAESVTVLLALRCQLVVLGVALEQRNAPLAGSCGGCAAQVICSGRCMQLASSLTSEQQAHSHA